MPPPSQMIHWKRFMRRARMPLPHTTSGSDSAIPKVTRTRSPCAAPATASTLSRLMMTSATTMTQTASQSDVPCRTLPSPSPSPVSWRSSFRAIQISRRPPANCSNGILRRYVMIVMNTRRSATAPSEPHTRPQNCWRRGRVRTASAITSALSPASERSMMTMLSHRAQNPGSRRKSTAPPRSGVWGQRHAPRAPAPRRQQRHHEEEDRDGVDRPPYRACEEDGQRALRHDQALAQRVFGEVAEHERQDQRRERIVELLEHVADDTEDQHIPDVDHAVVHGERPDAAHDDDQRRQDPERDRQDPGEERHEQQHHQHADDVARVHARDEAPHEVRVLREQHRPGLQAPDDQPADRSEEHTS